MAHIDWKGTAGKRTAWVPDRVQNRDRVAVKARDTFAMARIGAFCAASWLAAAVLYFGRHSVALMVLSGVVALGGFDLFRPE